MPLNCLSPCCVPNENPVQPMADAIPQANHEFSSFTCVCRANEIHPCTCAHGRRSSDPRFRGSSEALPNTADGGSFRRLVVRSDGAIHQPGTLPRPIP
jgi:hypothetical protein